MTIPRASELLADWKVGDGPVRIDDTMPNLYGKEPSKVTVTEGST